MADQYLVLDSAEAVHSLFAASIASLATMCAHESPAAFGNSDRDESFACFARRRATS